LTAVLALYIEISADLPYLNATSFGFFLNEKDVLLKDLRNRTERSGDSRGGAMVLLSLRVKLMKSSSPVSALFAVA
jgi:hypothetical protein